jgi:outer membrane receptor for ferric coprogen and ferric-rhodotorulic acid
MDLSTKWRIDADAHFVSAAGSVVTDNGGYIFKHMPAYIVLNTKLNYALTPTTDLALVGMNLAERHFEGPEPQLDFRGNNISGMPIGRTVLLTFAHRF